MPADIKILQVGMHLENVRLAHKEGRSVPRHSGFFNMNGLTLNRKLSDAFQYLCRIRSVQEWMCRILKLDPNEVRLLTWGGTVIDEVRSFQILYCGREKMGFLRYFSDLFCINSIYLDLSRIYLHKIIYCLLQRDDKTNRILSTFTRKRGRNWLMTWQRYYLPLQDLKIVAL